MAPPNVRALIKISSAMHEFWYRLTGGLIGGRLYGLYGARVLLLTTTGRKSGRERTTPLLCLEDGENLVVVASNGGDDRHPAWYLNLKSNPRAVVQLGSAKKTVVAETASAEEKGRLWPLIREMYAGYDDYQQRTTREIPVVILRPEEKQEGEASE